MSEPERLVFSLPVPLTLREIAALTRLLRQEGRTLKVQRGDGPILAGILEKLDHCGV
jgi:hypothetical protein